MTTRTLDEEATGTVGDANELKTRASGRPAARGRLAFWRELSPTWKVVLASFVVSRLVFFVAGAIASVSIAPARSGSALHEEPGFLHYWAHWDGAWYEGIARHGYTGFHAPNSSAFFPLYPLLVRAATPLFGGAAVAGVVVSTLLFCLALYFVAEIASTLYGPRVARATTLVLAFSPTSFFFNAVFTESLFVALTAGAVWAMLVREDLLLAGILGAFASATRQVGLLLLIPLVYDLLRNRGKRPRRDWLAPALVPLGLLGYMSYLRVEFGRWTAFADAEQDIWGRQLSNPVHSLERALHQARTGASYLAHPEIVFGHRHTSPAVFIPAAVALAALVLAGALLVVAFRTQPLGLSLYAAALVATPVLNAPGIALMSFPRYVLWAFPLFIALGAVLSRSRLLLAVWVASGTVLGCYFTVLFATWRWLA